MRKLRRAIRWAAIVVRPRLGIATIAILLSTFNFSQASNLDAGAAPYVNPHLANSTYPIAHSQTDSAAVAGPLPSRSRRLRPDEIKYAPTGPANSYGALISPPYPNGKRVIWTGGYDRISKVDAETLETLATYSLGDKAFFTESAIERHLAKLNELYRRGDDAALTAYGTKVWLAPWEATNTFYRLLSKDNEFYIPDRDAAGRTSIKVYGDEDAADPASRIRLKRVWHMPPELGRATICGMTIASDGTLVFTTMNGILVALAQDFSTYKALELLAVSDRNKSMRSSKEAALDEDIYDTFVRNGIDVDEKGGIYVVSRDYLYRVQWTGTKLSLDEADGGWKVSYPNETGRGSGTSPALMGWGDQEDHLIVIADGSRKNNAMVFWRDKIPDDWKGIAGFDRRIAGMAPIRFGVSENEPLTIETAPMVWGYGAFFQQFGTSDFNNAKPKYVGASLTETWLNMQWLFNKPGYECRGGTKLEWNPKTRMLNTVWRTTTNFLTVLQTVSRENGIIYGWGARNGEWTLEGTDWKTGKSAFHLSLGSDERFNPMGGLVNLAPDGAVICNDCGFGLVRVFLKNN